MYKSIETGTIRLFPSCTEIADAHGYGGAINFRRGAPMALHLAVSQARRVRVDCIIISTSSTVGATTLLRLELFTLTKCPSNSKEILCTLSFRMTFNV